jgi:nucleoside-diphosphate-sugar epimerase
MADSHWLDRPVLVTGATGLLGGWLVRELVDRGADVVCIVRDWIPHSEFARAGLLDRVRVVRGSVRDQALLERGIGEYEIDTVFHLSRKRPSPSPTAIRCRRSNRTCRVHGRCWRPAGAAPRCAP